MNIKLLPYNPKGAVDIYTAPPTTITPGTRSAKPYPPGAVTVNADAWPNGKTYVGTVTLAWTHRSRTAQAGMAVVRQDAASTTTQPEGNYTVEVLVEGVVKRTSAGITGTSYAYTLAMRTADDANLAKRVQFRITPMAGSVAGPARTTDYFVMS